MTMALTQVTTGGVDENINIDSNTLKVDGTNNRVGIGTAAPSRSLDVSGSGVHVSNTGTTGAAFNIIPAANGQDGAELILSYHSGSGYGPLKFNVGNAERLRIDSSGRAGVGLTPASATLEVQGQNTYQNSASTLATAATKAAFRVKGSTNSSDGLWMGVETSNAEPYIQGANGIGSATKNILLNPFGGNIGLGTTSPGRQLTLSHASQAAIGLLSGADTSGALIYQNASEQKLLIANRESDGHIAFQTGGVNERMRIDSSGNAGIGTSSPSFSTFGSNTGGIHIKDVGSSNSGIKIEHGSNHLHLVTSGSRNFIHSGSNIPLAFSTNDSERMRIDSSGRLLVGLTSPLQANDKISVDGQVGIGGQRYGFLNKSVSVGNSVSFDIGGAVNNAVFVRVRIKVGYSGNSNYQMHAQYDYITCNYSTSGGTATITNIAQIEAGNAQFNTSDWSVSRPANRTVRLTYSPSSGAGTHSPTIYVDGLFSTIS